MKNMFEIDSSNWSILVIIYIIIEFFPIFYSTYHTFDQMHNGFIMELELKFEFTFLCLCQNLSHFKTQICNVYSWKIFNHDL
jgi:hypothetical protein